MSGIVLSSAVRQNLLALQDTAASLATTQNDLSTGKKVNSALDNPTNFFTAAGLDNRASDISNLLDGISNGVQVLQAANTGITSLESLVSQAKSIANQALQTSIGYSTKSSVTSTAITNAGTAVTADDLRGAGTFTTASVTGTAATAPGGPSAPLSATSKLSDIFTAGDKIFLNNVEVDFNGTGSDSATALGGGQSEGLINFNVTTTTATLGDLLAQTNGSVTGFGDETQTSSFSVSGALTLTNSTNPLVHNTGDAAVGSFAKLGISAADLLANPTALTFTGTNVTVTPAPVAISGSTLISNLTSAIGSSDTLTVNGKTITFASSGSNSITSTGATLNASTATVQNVLDAIDKISGGAASIGTGVNAGKITLTGGNGSIALTGSALSKIALTATTGNSASVTASGGGNTLSFASIGNGTATTITFGDGTGGTVKTLSDLNAELATDNLSATLDTAGKLTITTTNDAASFTISTPTGTAVTASTGGFHTSSVVAPVADTTSQTARSTLVTQYNAILTQIDNTASDASYNGVNLLAGDQLQLTFNETGKSKLNITGVNFGAAGLGLSTLATTAFKDNNATNTILGTLNTVSSTLRSQASALGSNLSVVQTRQDFNKNLINVLQTGSANLTQADINLEAANSQALSTRQSLSVSALSLANQSQQSVLQLLR